MYHQQPVLAKLTMAAFEDAVQRDQGNAFRANLERVLPHVGDAYKQNEEPFRSHLGASVVGKECGRAIWYDFHWATRPAFSGRIIRLFNRGHLEEARSIALLLTIGCEVFQQDAEGKQYRISYHAGHFGGSGDGVVIGLPDLAPGQPALCEFKTHNDKSFQKLKTDGCRVAKFDHFIQQQMYMRRMGLAVSFYCATNKNDDELYCELVPLVPEMADEFIDRAGTIINGTIPKKINESPGWFTCRFCDHKPVCHLSAPPERNCRTCAHAAVHTMGPTAGKWTCENKERQLELLFDGTNPKNEDFSLTKERQLEGCRHYEKHPAFE
jgi:hypothetical protein